MAGDRGVALPIIITGKPFARPEMVPVRSGPYTWKPVEGEPNAIWVHDEQHPHLVYHLRCYLRTILGDGPELMRAMENVETDRDVLEG